MAKNLLQHLSGGILLLILFAMMVPAAELAAEPTTGCSSAANRQFDFWAGRWDVFESDTGKKVAHARVDSILDGCVLREDYEQLDGHHGQSFTSYDSARGLWHQSWVTNRGESLEIEGKFDGHSIIMTGEDRAAGTLVRGTWTPEQNGVREVAVTSTDAGKTWKPWFDIIFRTESEEGNDPRRASDSDAVKNLDTRYQKAVKENDVSTMDRLLANDFMLVTGSGKTFSKADLLEEARSGRYHYDRQDDEEQTVRIWGDTAVVSAKLIAKGTESGTPFDYQVWFSDTYVRGVAGWKYVFGQSSLRLKPAQ
jgi:ketosteroid isomerase-like protein